MVGKAKLQTACARAGVCSPVARDLQPLLVRPHKRSPAATNRTGFVGRQPDERFGDITPRRCAGAQCPGRRLRVNKGQIALLCVYGMPELPPDKAYQVWLIKDGKRESGGVFQVSEYGFGFLMVRPTYSLSEYSSVGITVEPVVGSPAPTSPRVLGGTL